MTGLWDVDEGSVACPASSVPRPQATSIAAQMKTRGVTTVLCACDPIFEILISQNAWQQKYVPEWFVVAWLDPQGRQAEQNEWKHDHGLNQDRSAFPCGEPPSHCASFRPEGFS